MIDKRSANLLETAIETLRAEVLPALDDQILRIKLDHVTRLLWDVSARLSRREAGLRDLIAGLARLVPIEVPGAGADAAELERRRAEAEALVAERLPHWCAPGGNHAALQQLVAIERAFYVAQDPDVAQGSAVVYRGGRVEGERARPSGGERWPDLDAATLTAYVREHFGRGELVVTDVRRIPGGFSKETVFLTLIDGNGERDQLVIRKDLPVPLIEKTVVNEYPLLKALHEHGFPVAEPVWLEDDASRFGGAFLVSRRCRGTSDAAQWSSDPARARSACTELARLLARLHGTDPADLGIQPKLAALSAGEHMTREIDLWIDLFHRKRAEAFPLQELPLVWLRNNVPASLFNRPARIIHGDVGFHNLMFDEAGQITALLDWEFSVLGDPTQDLGFAQQFVAPLMDWSEFLAIYAEAGGPEPCADAEFFYDLWTRTRNAVGCVDAQTLFDDHMNGEMRFALAGHIFAPYMFVDQCEVLIGHLLTTDLT